jgi:hypothetical protein
MKKTYLFIMVLLLMLPVSLSYSQLLNENFDYPAGDTLTNHGWSNHSGTGNFITISTGSLYYYEYLSSGIGNQVVLVGGSGSREDVNTGIAEQNTNGASLYYSFLINVASAANTADYIILIGDRSSPTSFTLFSARVFIQNESGNLKFGLSNSTTATMGTTNFSYGTTYLVFVKYTINTGGTDECKLWVFSTGVPLSELAAGTPEVTNTSTSGQDVIDAIALRQGSTSYSAAIDGIRVSTIWDELVPVELTSLTAVSNGSNVLLNWSTASELNNAGFNVQRSIAGNEFTTIGFVPGYGTTTEAKTYRFVDANLLGGSYTYRLRQVDFNGTFSYSNEINVDVEALLNFELAQNYPNPFNPSTTINFSIPQSSKVTLKIFNTLGQEVSTLINQDMESGVHKINFDASELNSGVYFYRLDVGSFSEVKKLTLIK